MAKVLNLEKSLKRLIKYKFTAIQKSDFKKIHELIYLKIVYQINGLKSIKRKDIVIIGLNEKRKGAKSNLKMFVRCGQIRLM